MNTKTRYIIVLDPSSCTYLLSWDVPAESVLKPWPVVKATPTTDKADALRFDSFQDAMDVAQDIRGWGGTQRVESVADVVEPAVTASLATPAGRIEARDAATFAFHEEADRLQDNDAGLLAAVQALRDLGYRAADAGNRSISIADPEGNLLDLDWDPGVDGFDYATSGDDGCDLDEVEANTEDEPETCTCDGCGEDDAEDAGEGFAFCNDCRAKDANAPRA